MAYTEMTTVDISLISTDAFLNHLQNSDCAILSGRAIVGRVPGQWRTEPRKSGRTYPLHYLFSSPYTELIIRSCDEERRIKAGTLCWFPPNVPYEIFMDSRKDFEVLHRLRFRMMDEERIMTPFTEATFVENAEFMGEYTYRCLSEFVSQRPFNEYRLRCQLGLLCSECFTRLDEQDEQRERGKFSPSQISRLQDYVTTHCHERLTPADLADFIGYSPIYFSRLFKRTTGISPKRWLLEQRIKQAAQRLCESSATVSEIALEYGYDNPFLFSRQFSSVMGFSPSGYRERLR